MMWMGLEGMPRRYADYAPEYTIWHRVSTVGACILITSVLAMLGALVYALFRGQAAEDNPWGGKTLEWQTPTPPPLLNFDELPEEVKNDMA